MNELALHINYVPILHRFWDTARYWSKVADLNLPHLYLSPQQEISGNISETVRGRHIVAIED